MQKTIVVKELGKLTVAKTSKKTYFVLLDTDDVKYLCFVPSLYTELRVGEECQVEVKESKFADGDPSIEGIVTGDGEQAPKAVSPPAKSNPVQEKKYGRDEDKVDYRTAMMETGHNIRSGVVEVSKEVRLAYTIGIRSMIGVHDWMTELFELVEKLSPERRTKLIEYVKKAVKEN